MRHCLLSTSWYSLELQFTAASYVTVRYVRDINVLKIVWFPMKERIDFHLLQLVFKVLYFAPSHLTSRSMRLSIHVCCVLNAEKRFTLSTAALHEKTLTASRFFWINMTNSLRKKSYSENTEFSCWLVVIVLFSLMTIHWVYKRKQLQTRETSLGTLSAAWLPYLLG